MQLSIGLFYKVMIVGLKIVGLPYHGKTQKHFNNNKRLLQSLCYWFSTFPQTFIQSLVQ